MKAVMPITTTPTTGPTNTDQFALPDEASGIPPSVSRDVQALIHFDLLPDSAFVRVHTIAGLFGISKQTVYQWVREGRWPKQLRLGRHHAVWSVAAVRSARASLVAQASAS
jgi:predicted DNA-binding transcriptional regulator AlpA